MEATEVRGLWLICLALCLPLPAAAQASGTSGAEEQAPATPPDAEADAEAESETKADPLPTRPALPPADGTTQPALPVELEGPPAPEETEPPQPQGPPLSAEDEAILRDLDLLMIFEILLDWQLFSDEPELAKPEAP